MILREWTKIDVHRYVEPSIDRFSVADIPYTLHRACLTFAPSFRIDKFYMLIRRFVDAAFRLQLRENWDDDCCEAYEYILTRPNGPLE